MTDSEKSREALKFRLREAVARGLAPEARVRVTQLVFGPYSPFPVAWRVMGPDVDNCVTLQITLKVCCRPADDENRQYRLGFTRTDPAFHLDQNRLQLPA